MKGLPGSRPVKSLQAARRDGVATRTGWRGPECPGRKSVSSRIFARLAWLPTTDEPSGSVIRRAAAGRAAFSVAMRSPSRGACSRCGAGGPVARWLPPPSLTRGGIGRMAGAGQIRFRRLEQFFQPDRMGDAPLGVRSVAEVRFPDDSATTATGEPGGPVATEDAPRLFSWPTGGRCTKHGRLPFTGPGAAAEGPTPSLAIPPDSLLPE